jgi:hypothetical protein
MRLSFSLAIVALLAGHAIDASAQQGRPATMPRQFVVVSPFAPQQTKTLTSELFRADIVLPKDAPGDTATRKSQRPNPRVVCGLTVWQVDPDFDAKIRITPPNTEGVDFTIRRITPPPCPETPASTRN